MGYSATQKANESLDALFETLPSSNTWYSPKGHKCFYEIGRENADGSITGSIWKFITPDSREAVKYASFKIDKDGKLVRFPLITKEMKARAVESYERLKIQDNFLVSVTTFNG